MNSQTKKNEVGVRVISDLSVALPQSSLARENRHGKWRIFDYATPTIQGTMLFAAQDAAPGQITVPLDAEGWHAIYLGLPQGMFIGGDIKCKLSSEKFWSPVMIEGCPGYDMMREGFWKYADLTNEALEVERGHENSALGYIRLVPLSAEEVSALQTDRARTDTRKLIATHDAEFWYHWGSNIPPERQDILDEIYGGLEIMRDTDFGVVMPQITGQFFSEVPSFAEIEWSAEAIEVIPNAYRKCIDDSRRMNELDIDWMKEYVGYAHGMGLKVWVGLRGSQMAPPPVDELWTARFAKEHPEFMCRDRDNNPVYYLSWFFPEVRQRIHRVITELISYGIDGVGLSLVRSGPFTLYEEPVVAEFQKRYGYDPRERNEDDPNWMEFKAMLMTGYMEEIREILDDSTKASGSGHLDFIVETHGPRETNRFWGYDIETWACRGIVDVIIAKDQVFKPGTMEYAGKNDDFRDPAVAVDYEYFTHAVKGTQCRLYHDLLPRIMPPNEYRDRAARAYAHGFDGLAFWDGPGSRLHLNQWEVVRRLGHPEELECRTEISCEPILSFNGVRIDRYPVWWTW